MQKTGIWVQGQEGGALAGLHHFLMEEIVFLFAGRAYTTYGTPNQESHADRDEDGG